jgi:hypothetical protein
MKVYAFSGKKLQNSNDSGRIGYTIESTRKVIQVMKNHPWMGFDLSNVVPGRLI